MKYRADVDGLRTVAVLPVVLFHAGLPLLSGGFVGVDVFFVISGYLITRLLLGDVARDEFSIARFYERRIRRIFPALAAVLLFCLVAGFVVMAPADYADLGRSVVSVTLFLSNLHFWKSVDYFDATATPEPLLHTWSLAVEEQFYIFYPLLLAWLVRRKARVQAWLIAIAIVSLIGAAIMVQVKPSATFYLLPTRSWELLAGAIVAVGSARRAPPAWLVQGGGIAGLAMIAVPMVLYTSATTFPGLAAVPPVLGAALIIWAGQYGAAPVGRLLSTRPFVFVGRASYSFYLWHAPVLSFARYLRGQELPLGIALLCCAIAFGLAVLSLYWIEQPFRRHRPGARHPLAFAVGLPSAGMIAAGLAAVMVVAQHGLPTRLDPQSARFLATAGDKNRLHLECMSSGNVIVPPANACHLGTAGVRPHVLLWGDSHASIAAIAMKAYAARHGDAFWLATTADCPVGLGFAISDRTERVITTTPSYRFCRDYNEQMFARAVHDPAIDTVVLAARWSNWRIGAPHNPAEAAADIRLEDRTGIARSTADNRAIFERGFTELLRRLHAAGKRVFVVGPVPEPRVDVPHALFIQKFGLAPPLHVPTIADYRQRHAAILAIFARAQKVAPFTLIRPERVLCDADGVCPLVRDGQPTFLDHNHLSVVAAQRTAPLYAPVFARR